MRTFAIGFALGLAAFGLAKPAFAQSNDYPTACNAATVTTARSEEGHAAYKEGRVAYDEAKYAESIVAFRRAYQLDCSKHELLVVLSRAYELSGNRVEAIRALELYLERVKDSPDAPTHRARIENLKRLAPSPSPAPAPPRTPEATPMPAPPPPPVVVREHTAWPWVFVGLGGLAAATGVVVFATAPKLPKNCDADTGKCVRIPGDSVSDYEDQQSKAGLSQTQPTTGIIIAGSGLVLVAGGLVWHFLESTGPAPATAGLKPELAPGYAGMTFGKAF